MIQRNDPCWCGSEKKWKKCHYPHPDPTSPSSSEERARHYLREYKIILKTPLQIEGIRRASRLCAKILDETCKRAKEGVTTEELNQFAHQLHKSAGAIPAPLGYGHPPFPKSICTSLNEVICHGIPDSRPLKEGDILNIDVSLSLNGYYGDCSRMVIIGKTTEERALVTEVAYECLMRSIAILKPTLAISEIGAVIDSYARSKGCSVVHQFVGHGVGVHFHENPEIPHNRNRIQIPLVPGMTFTIEPMINAGVPDAIVDAKDHWTVRTADGRASAQCEHTILITETGHEILTLP